MPQQNQIIEQFRRDQGLADSEVTSRTAVRIVMAHVPSPAVDALLPVSVHPQAPVVGGAVR